MNLIHFILTHGQPLLAMLAFTATPAVLLRSVTFTQGRAPKRILQPGWSRKF